MKIVSGGQTGADRAALDWAIENGIEHGGWCPEGRLAEDGVIPAHYQVVELAGAGYRARTKANVRDSDATLIISIEPVLTTGSKHTQLFAQAFGKPCQHIYPAMDWRHAIKAWLDSNAIQVLNIAGPRASSEPEISSFTTEVLEFTLQIYLQNL
jgi:hypothetical protein